MNAGDFDANYRVNEVGRGENCPGGDQGFVVSSIVCEPAERCVSVSAFVGQATVRLVGGETMTVIYTNEGTQ